MVWDRLMVGSGWRMGEDGDDVIVGGVGYGVLCMEEL